MESYHQENKEIFQFGMDEQGRAHMMETARWAKFIAIALFIILTLLLLFAIGLGISGLASDLDMYATSLGFGRMAVYVIIVLLYLYPTYCLYKFSTLIKPALNTNNQSAFNTALLHLKRMFRFTGILMIVMLALYGIIFLLFVLGVALG